MAACSKAGKRSYLSSAGARKRCTGSSPNIKRLPAPLSSAQHSLSPGLLAGDGDPILRGVLLWFSYGDHPTVIGSFFQPLHLECILEPACSSSFGSEGMRDLIELAFPAVVQYEGGMEFIHWFCNPVVPIQVLHLRYPQAVPLPYLLPEARQIGFKCLPVSLIRGISML